MYLQTVALVQFLHIQIRNTAFRPDKLKESIPNWIL